MKAKIYVIFMAMLTLIATVALSSCDAKTEYDKLDDSGYTISVKFDSDGGTIKGSNSTVIDVFNPDNYTADANGKIKISLRTPDDPARDKNNRLTITKPDHYIVGWYATRTPIDENDLSKGYTYSDRWDFENDTLTLDKDGDYTASTNQLVLYAAWVPYFNFEIYAPDENGQFSLLETKKALSFDLPVWEDGAATVKMGDISKRRGYTFDAAYLDENMTTPITESSISGVVDYETGKLKTATIKLYTTWLEGNHYRIYSVDQLNKNASYDGVYHIMNDLDFGGKSWDFYGTGFSGKLYGNGHKISNISFATTYASASNGLFASVNNGALVKDITFENITHKINVGITKTDDSFGLFAGKIADGAVLDNVSISGSLLFGQNCENLQNYSGYYIGIFASNGTPDGIDVSDITYDVYTENDTAPTFTVVEEDDGVLKLVFN